jgi:HEAT repeat protein
MESARLLWGQISARAENLLGGLVRKLEHENGGVRKAALESISRLEDAVDAETQLAVVRCLEEDPESAVRRAATETLRSFPPSVLLAMLRHEVPCVCVAAVQALSELPADVLQVHGLDAPAFGPEVASAVRMCASKECEDTIRVAALTALGKLTPVQVIQQKARMPAQHLAHHDTQIARARG